MNLNSAAIRKYDTSMTQFKLLNESHIYIVFSVLVMIKAFVKFQKLLLFIPHCL